MNASDDIPGHSARWPVRPRAITPDSDAPPVVAVLREELVRIDRRIDDVITQGREEFTEGSDSYDRATVAILRLAALFEDEKRFAALLSVVTPNERRGIATTRSITAHSRYGAMNTEIFWHTVTGLLPEVIARIRTANQL